MAGRMNLARAMVLTGNVGRRRDDEDGEYRRRRWDDEPRRMGYDVLPEYEHPLMRGRRRNVDDDFERREDGGRRMGFYDRPMPTEDGGYDGHRMGYDTPDMRRRRNMPARMHYGHHADDEGEPIHFGGMVSMSGGRQHPMRMTREMAEEWVDGLENTDPAKPHGAKWTMEQVRPLAQRYGIPTEGEKFYEFFAVINAMYSDYFMIAKKYGAAKDEFFADLAMAFISDKDAVEGKAAMYYECIARKE